MFEELESLNQLQLAQLDLFQAALFGFRVPKKAKHAVLILVILSIVVPTLTFAFASYYSYRSHINRARERLTHTVEVVRENAFKSFARIYSVAKEANGILDGLSDEQIRSNQEDFHRRLKALTTGVEEIEDVWLLNRDGIGLVSAATFPLPQNSDLSDRDYYLAHRDGLLKPDAPFVSRVQRGRVRGRIFFAFSWARKNELGAFGGVIGASVEPNSVSELFAPFLNKGASAIMLIRDDGAVLAQSSARQHDLLGSKIGPTILGEIAKNLGSSFLEAPSNVEGSKLTQLIAFEKVPGAPIYVVASYDKPTIVAVWKKELLRTLSFSGPLMLGLLGFGAVAYRVTRIHDEVEQRFRQFAEHSSAAIWTMNAADMRFDYLSPAFETIWGLGRREVMEQPGRLRHRLHPKDRRLVLKAMAQLRSGRFYTLEYRIVDPLTGSIKWIKDIGFPIADGRIGGIAADVTEKRLAEDQIQLLSQEVSHRAKNLLAVVQSIARQTITGGEPVNFAEGFTQRIAGLAASLDLLVNSGWQGVDLAQLVKSQLAPLVDLTGNQIELNGPPLIIEPSAAQTLGMALHELATNSIKYGALSSALGRISVEWSIETDSRDKRFHMTWSETGGPEPKAYSASRHGFGHVVIVGVVEYSLSARVKLQYPCSGLIWEVEAPLQALVEASLSIAEKGKPEGGN